MNPALIQGLLGILDIFRTEESDTLSRERTDWRTQIHDNFAADLENGDPYGAVHDYMNGNPLSGSVQDIASWLTPNSATGLDTLMSGVQGMFNGGSSWLDDLSFNNPAFQQYANTIGADTTQAQRNAASEFLAGNKIGPRGIVDEIDWNTPDFETRRQAGRNQVAASAKSQMDSLGGLAAQQLASGKSLEGMGDELYSARSAIGQNQLAGNLNVDSTVAEQQDNYGLAQDQIEAGAIGQAVGLDNALSQLAFSADSSLRDSITRGRFEAANVGANATAQNLSDIMNTKQGLLNALASFADSNYANQLGINTNALALSDSQQKQLAQEIQTQLGMQMEALGIGSNLYASYSPTVGLLAPVFQNAYDTFLQSNVAGAKSGGGGGVSVLGTGANVSKSCISGSDQVFCESGPKPLCEVEIGDKVLTPSGEYVAVLAKDYGIDESQKVSRRLTTSHGFQVTITDNHPLAGVCAGNYEVGDDVKLADGNVDSIATIEEVPYPPSGDLYLENNTDYCVGNFTVSSVISEQIEKYGLEEWKLAQKEMQEAYRESQAAKRLNDELEEDDWAWSRPGGSECLVD